MHFLPTLSKAIRNSLIIVLAALTLTACGSDSTSSNSVSVLSIRDELHSGVQPGDSITLNVSGKLLTVISVDSLNPDITYAEGIDYVVDLAFGTISIVPGGAIFPDTNLFITYNVRVNTPGGT